VPAKRLRLGAREIENGAGETPAVAVDARCTGSGDSEAPPGIPPSASKGIRGDGQRVVFCASKRSQQPCSRAIPGLALAGVLGDQASRRREDDCQTEALSGEKIRMNKCSAAISSLSPVNGNWRALQYETPRRSAPTREQSAANHFISFISIASMLHPVGVVGSESWCCRLMNGFQKEVRRAHPSADRARADHGPTTARGLRSGARGVGNPQVTAAAPFVKRAGS